MCKINLPEIKIERDNTEEETKVFSNFLYHTYYIQNRLIIFKAFPGLSAEIEKLEKKDSEGMVRRF